MRYLLWLARIVLFLLLLGFAMKNSEPVVVRYFFGQEWHAPLAFVLLLGVCAGVALGIVAALGTIFRQRRELLDLKRKLRSRASTPIETAPRHPEAG